MKKRLISLIAVMAMMVSLVSAIAGAESVADSGTCGENITWTLDSEGTLTISGKGEIKDYYYSQPSPFYNNSNIKTVVIENGITGIGSNLFYYCKSITSVIMSDSITSIGNCAFQGCLVLENVIMPSGMTSIDADAFNNCVLLTDISLPSNIISIGQRAFNGTGYYNDKNNWENGLLYIGEYLITAKSDELPDECTVKDGTKLIAEGAFTSCGSLMDITIPNSVTHIGQDAFDYCESLKSVSLPEGITKIEDSCFNYCEALERINIPSAVTSIGYNAFFACKALADITLPDSITSIGSGAFMVTGYYDNDDNWEGGALYNGRYLVGIKNEEISGEYVIKDGTTVIAEGVFAACEQLTGIIIPNGITSLESFTFHSSGLESVVIPDSVVSIGDNCFDECQKLKSVVIGSGLENISDYVFNHCISMKSIEVSEENQHYKAVDNVLFSKDGTKLVLYPSARDGNTYIIPDGTEIIGNDSMRFCGSLTSVIIPDSVKVIGSSVFELTPITDIIIPDSVESIGESAFLMCQNLKHVKLSESVTEIANDTFAGCISLNDITIPSNVKTIGDRAFVECAGLKSITVGKNVMEIGKHTFYLCDSLTDVYYEGVEEEWNTISIGEQNECFTNANVTFSVVMNTPTPTTAPTITPTESPSASPTIIPTSTPIPSVTKTLTGFSVKLDGEHENCVVYAAVYDENGILLRLNRELLKTGSATDIAVDFTDGAYAKVFILTNNFAPVLDTTAPFEL